MTIGKYEVGRGNALTITVTVKLDGTPVDETGWTAFLTVKKWPEDSDADAVIAYDIDVDEGTAEAVFEITAEDNDIDPGLYYYDIKTQDPDDKPENSDTGIYQITDVITKRVRA